MTCIVGWTNGKNVWMGCDSAGVGGGYDLSIRSDKKIFIRDEMIYGFTSSFRMGQILRSCFSRPEQSSKKDDYDYLCSDYIDALIDCMKKKGFAKIDDGVVEGGTFLLGYKGNLYIIESDFQVGKVYLPFNSIGCGSKYALGYMWSYRDFNQTFTKDSVEGILDSALLCSEQLSAGVRGPFHFLKL